MSDMDLPIPPASFEFLIVSLKMQCEMQLGLLNFGDESEKQEPDLRVAQHSIDMLAMLQEKTRGNLTLEEQRLLENSLTELRFRYVHASNAAKSQKVESAPPEIPENVEGEQASS